MSTQLVSVWAPALQVAGVPAGTSIPVALLWRMLVAQLVAQQWDGGGATAELSASPLGRGRTRTEMDEEKRSCCYHGLTDASTLMSWEFPCPLPALLSP